MHASRTDQPAAGCPRCDPIQGLLLLHVPADTGRRRRPSLRRSNSGPTGESHQGVRGLAEHMERALPGGWCVLCAEPSASSLRSALRRAHQNGVTRLVILPTQPLFDACSTGRRLKSLYRRLGSLKTPMDVEVRSCWHDDASFIDAAAAYLHRRVQQLEFDPTRCRLLFVAPRAHRSCGSGRLSCDALRCAELISERLGWPSGNVHLVFTGADASDGELAAAVDPLNDGSGDPVLCCSLTGSALVGEAALGRVLPGCDVHVCPPMVEWPDLTKALLVLIRRGRHPIVDHPSGAPLFAPVDRPKRVSAEVTGRLFMVGASLPGPLGAGEGPSLRFCDEAVFQAIKRPHLEAVDLLRRLQNDHGLPECWVWNTCHRFELYGWFDPKMPDDARQGVVRHLVDEVSHGNADAASRVDTLTGAAAHQHLLRTAIGLNSGLIGDAEVVDQLLSAHRTAQYAGTAGAHTAAIVDETARVARSIRTRTRWGAFQHHYCQIALDRLAPRLEQLVNGRILVLGGSTTACSILDSLRRRFDVPADRLRLIYRGKRRGALIKRMHEFVGEGNALTVEHYADALVLEHIAQADVLFLGIDSREPVLAAGRIAALRDLKERPLVAIDFNSFGSIETDVPAPGMDLIDAPRINDLVTAFNGELLACDGLHAAAHQAEAAVAEHLGLPRRHAGGEKADRHAHVNGQASARSVQGVIE